MRSSDGGWTAACEASEVERRTLAEAIRAAIAGGALPLRRDETIERWIEETAAHIVGDTLH